MLALLLSCAPAVEPAPCVPADVTITPPHGELHVNPERRPTVELSDPAATPRLWVDGGVSGAWALDRAGRWHFTPDAPFARGTAYTVLAEVCDVETTSTFRTLDPAVGDSAVGRVYRMELDAPDIQWLEPQGARAVAEFFEETESLLFAVTGREGDSLQLVLAAGWVPVTHGRFDQYPCLDPVAFEAAFRGDPLFGAGPSDIELHATASNGVSFGLHEFVATGQISQDASAIQDLELDGLVDLTEVNVGLDRACSLAASLGSPCEPCTADDDTASCVRLRLRDPEAPAWDGVFHETLDPEACP